MRRQILIVAVLLVAVLAACTDSGEDFTEPARPRLVLQSGDTAVEGTVVNICWPKGEGNASCEPNFSGAEPGDSLAVTKDDTVSVGFGTAASPDEVVVKSGSIELTFQANQAPQIPMNLFNDGRNNIEVTAYYFDLEGTQGVVSSVFAVDVGSAVVAEPSPTEASATQAVIEEATEEATEAVIETTPTEAATTPEPTEPDETEEVEATTPATVAATATRTQIAPTIGSPTAPPITQPATTQAAPNTPAVVQPTATATTLAPTQPPSPIPASATPSPTLQAAPTIVLPSATVPPLNATDIPAFVGVAPEVTLRIGGREYSFVGVDFCRRAGNNQQVCIAQPAAESARLVRIGSGNAFIVRISDVRPVNVTVEARNPDTLEAVLSEELVGDNNVLVSLDLPADDYLLAIEVVWPDKSGTYYYRVRILE